MRPTSARSTGIRRFSSAVENGELSPVDETIDIANFSGQTAIDITQITGVDISKFYAVDIVFDNAVTTTGGTNVKKGVQVSTDGGSTFLETGYMDMLPGTTSNQTLVAQAISASTFTAWCRLTNTNQTGIPCHFKNTYNTAAPSMGRINSTMAVIDALRFEVSSTGDTISWVSGTIRIRGYRKAASKITTQTDSFDGVKTEIIFNIPAGHTYATLEVEDVSAASGFGLAARFGNGGVFRSDADQLRQTITSGTVGSQGITESVFWITDSSVTQDANAEFWNLNTAAPVIMAAMAGDTGSTIRNLGMSPVATSFSQIRLFGISASEVLLTGGTVRLTTYKIKNEVFSWAPDGSASHDFTGLGKYSGAVLASPTLTVLSATDTIRATVSGDVGASDYRPHITATQTQEAAFRVSEDNQTNARFSAVFTSLNSSKVSTQMAWGSNHFSGLIRQVAGLRDAAQKDTSIQVKTTGGATMNSAPLPIYLVGYKL